MYVDYCMLELREKMMAVSAKSFILADSSKFGLVGRTTIAVGGNTTILSDTSPDADIGAALEAAGIRFVSTAGG